MSPTPSGPDKPGDRVRLTARDETAGLTPLDLRLRQDPGRCPCCGYHLATQGHAPHCLLGPRAWVTLAADGRLVHNPAPAPAEPARVGPGPDRRYGPLGTCTPVGRLPTTCTACGAYPTERGGGHRALCPRGRRW